MRLLGLLSVILPLLVPVASSGDVTRQKTYPSGFPAVLISDEQFTFAPDFSAEEIQRFLNEQPGILKTYGESVRGERLSAAEIIFDATFDDMQLGIALNSQVLLVLLELNAHLLSDPSPSEDALQFALGFRDPAWAGLSPQLRWATRQLKRAFVSYEPGRSTIMLPDSSTYTPTLETNADTFAVQTLLARMAPDLGTWEVWVSERPDSFKGVSRYYFSPIRCLGSATASVSPFLYQPYSGAEVPITAVFDHSNPRSQWPPYTDGVIRPFSGEIANRNPYRSGNLVAYTTQSGRSCIPGSVPYSDGSRCWYDGHTGYDYGTSASVRAAADGFVEKVCRFSSTNNCDGFGNYVLINHRNNYRTFYAHLAYLTVSQGNNVSRGNLLGRAGSTGGATGTHLHFETRYTGTRTGTRTDPYGWCGDDSDPLGHTATWLWADKANPCGAPAAPSDLRVDAVGRDRVRLAWSDVSGEDGYKIAGHGRYYTVRANVTSKTITGLRCDKNYHFRVASYRGNTSSSYAWFPSVRTDSCSVTSADITNVQFRPVRLTAGELLEVRITVRNTGNTVIYSQGPNPHFTYSEGETFESRGYPSQQGKFRVGVDFGGRTGIDHPYRWGLSKNLNPGESVEVVGYIRLNAPRTVDYWAGLVQEYVKWHTDQRGKRQITVDLVVSCPDAYEPNGDWYNSTNISLGSQIQAYICDSNDVDWFYVLVPSSGRLVVDLWNLPGDYDIKLFHGPDGYLTGSYYGSTHSEHIEYDVEADPTIGYDVKIYGWAGAHSATSPYSLRIQLQTGMGSQSSSSDTDRESRITPPVQVTSFPTAVSPHVVAQSSYSVTVGVFPDSTGIVSPTTGYYTGYTLFTATPNPGYDFLQWWIWQGEWHIYTSNPLLLDINQDTYVLAEFRPVGTSIYGRVNWYGNGIADVPLELRFFDGDTFTTIATTTTDIEGNYDFTGIPSLGPDQLYYVRFLNETGNPDFLWGWWGNYITEHFAGESVRGGDFDISEVPLNSPDTPDDQYFPVDFAWSPRGWYPEEGYIVEIWNDEEWYWSPLQGNVGSLELDRLPPEITAATDSWWDLVILAKDGYGVSWDMHQLKFGEGTGNIYGQVTNNGLPDSGVPVGLYYYDSSEWYVYDWTFSDADGTYVFSRLPSLQSGEAYAPFFFNFDDPDKPDRLWWFACYAMSEYDANKAVHGCDIETADVSMGRPYIEPEFLPTTFEWTSREVAYDEGYELKVYDFEAGQEFATGDLGYVGTYTMTALPSGFESEGYWWETWAWNEEGYGISYAINYVNKPTYVYLPVVLKGFGGSVTASQGHPLRHTAEETNDPGNHPISRDMRPVPRPARFERQDSSSSLFLPLFSAITSDRDSVRSEQW